MFPNLSQLQLHLLNYSSTKSWRHTWLFLLFHPTSNRLVYPSYWPCLQNISRIQLSITTTTTIILIQVAIISDFNNCPGILTGIPALILVPQSISTGRVTCYSKKKTSLCKKPQSPAWSDLLLSLQASLHHPPSAPSSAVTQLMVFLKTWMCSFLGAFAFASPTSCRVFPQIFSGLLVTPFRVCSEVLAGMCAWVTFSVEWDAR